MKDLDRDMQAALAGSEEDLKVLAYHHSPKVISCVVQNRNLTEDLAVIIAQRRNIGTEGLESLYKDARWKESYRIMHALCTNPKTPQKISMALLKTLRVFDLGDLTRNQQVPANVRMRAEAVVSERILSIPLGIKKALAKRASNNILMRLIEDGMREVVMVCLESPSMTEGIINKIVNKPNIVSHVVRQIADHPKWSGRYDVQRSLIRNNHTPLSRAVLFLQKMKTTDLKELLGDPDVPSSTRSFVYRELRDRGETVQFP